VIPSRNEQKILPVTGDTRIDLGVLQPGELEGSIVVTTTHVFRVEGMHCGRASVELNLFQSSPGR
jgi:hypothetical protein